MEDFEKYIVRDNTNIRDAVRKIDLGGIGFVTVITANNKIVGVITDGDFRRAVLDGISLNENVLKIANTNFKYLNANYTKEEAIICFEERIGNYLPVLDQNELIDIVSKSQLLNEETYSYDKIKAHVVIMAGGKGTRMEPFTKVLPKPLIPIGDRTMIEIIMDEYWKYGIEDFFVSVNYKANMMKAYFEYEANKYLINFLDEDTPLGTAGALKLLDGKLSDTLFVSNCDIIIKEDYSKILNAHQSSDSLLTLVCSMQHIKIPYGVCDINTSGDLIGIQEKPEYDFLVNSGMYILSPEVLHFIPENTYFDITSLIEILLKKKLKVSVYPVSESSYLDVGQWAEYRKAYELLSV